MEESSAHDYSQRGCLKKEILDELIDKSFKVKENAHNEYSHFRVGCALLCEDGTIFVGANVENASIGLTICAERSAFCAAISQGQRKFKAVVISSDMKEFIPPCGACRQFMAEFAMEAYVYMTKPDRSFLCRKLEKLLPYTFIDFPKLSARS